jgi:hypothetical protein
MGTLPSKVEGGNADNNKVYLTNQILYFIFEQFDWSMEQESGTF